jgi:hypothetical protein
VRAGREDLGQDGDVQAGFGQLQRGAHAGAAGADDDRVKAAGSDGRFDSSHDYTPENLRSVASAADQPHDGGNLQDQAQADGLDVVHPDVTHADPGVEEQRHEHGKGSTIAARRGRPAFVAEVGRVKKHTSRMTV